jgi:hypothetical protein
MRTDDKCLRAFTKLRAFSWDSINHHWNVQLNPLAPPVFRPWFRMGEFLVVHTNLMIAAAIFLRGHKQGWRFHTSTTTDALIVLMLLNTNTLHRRAHLA